MAGSNPKITAEVSAVDHATQTLQNVAELSKRITRESNSALAQSAAASHSSIASQAAAAQARLQGLRTAAAEAALGLGVSFAGMAASVIRKSEEVGMAIERQIAKMRSFTDASAKDIARVRDLADTEGSKLPGGNVGFVEAARAASMSGVRPDLVGLAAKHGLMFSYETGDDPARGTENLLSHAAMLQDVRDDRDRPIPVREANAAQLERALTHAQNLLIEINKQAPGNLQDVYEGFKFGGPAALGAHIGAPQLAALYTQLAEHGIRGSEAGVAARAGFAALEAPTAKGRMAAAALGVDIDKYRTIDPANMTAPKILDGLAQRVGHDKAEHIRGAVEGAIARFQKDHDTRQFNDTLTRNIQHLSKNLADNVRASNLARDVMTPFVKSIDFEGFIKALKASGADAGAFNQIFGSKMGGKLIVLDGERLASLAAIFDKAQGGDNYQKSVSEYQNSYAGRIDRMMNSFSALADRVFQANKPLVEKMAALITAMTELASRHPNASTAIFDTAAVVGFVGALKAGTKILHALFGGSGEGKIVEGVLKRLGPELAPAGVVAGRTAPVAAAGSAAAVGLWAGALAAFDGAMLFAMGQYKKAHPDEFDARARAAYDRLHDSSDVGRQFGPFRHLVAPPGRNSGYRAQYELGRDDQERLEILRRSTPIAPKAVGTPRLGVPGSDATSQTGFGSRLIEKAADLLSMVGKTIGTIHPSEANQFGSTVRASPFGTAVGPQNITVAPSTVTGDVRGEVSLMQSFKVDASPLLIATVQGAKDAMKINLSGKLGQTMKGSNAAQASVPPGLTTFQPTLSGR